METVDIIRAKIASSPKGISAVFIPIDEKWGIKLFKSEEKRDGVKKTQKIFADCGYGPEVGESIDLPEKIEKYRFGYFTEIVETCIPGIHKENCTSSEEDKRHVLCKKFKAEYGDECRENSKVFNDLREAFDVVGVELSDMHAGNLGWKNGKIIPIDFGCD